MRYFGYGAVGVQWQKFADGEWCWEMNWAWFHPYERGHGHLTDLWPYFVERFQTFWLQQPLSAAMRGFVKKVGYDVKIAELIEAAKARREVKKQECKMIEK